MWLDLKSVDIYTYELKALNHFYFGYQCRLGHVFYHAS